MFVNLHTHKELDDGSIGITNLDNFRCELSDSLLYSVGIHPWNAIDNNWIYYLDRVKELSENKSVVAIGECGFDNLKGDSHIQDKLFAKQVEISEKVKKPLIIHSVGTHHKVLAAKKDFQPTQKWLLHSVLASVELGNQFMRENIYCSFAFRSLQNPRSIQMFKRYPLNLIFFETDDSSVPIDMIYTFAATILNCDVESLKRQCYLNFREFIGNG